MQVLFNDHAAYVKMIVASRMRSRQSILSGIQTGRMQSTNRQPSLPKQLTFSFCITQDIGDHLQ